MEDQLVRALLYDGSVAVLAADTTRLADKAREVHCTWPVCTAALGRAMTGALLMAMPVKHENGSVTLVFSGNGPAGTMVVVAKPNGDVKGYVENPNVDLPLNALNKLDVGGAIGKEGTLSVVTDTGRGDPYSGKTALVSGEIAEDIAAYFALSQQQPTLAYLGVLVDVDMRVLRSGGVFVQPLPGCPEAVTDALEAKAPALTGFGNALQAGCTVEAALERIFDDTDIRVLESIRPQWRCDCSPERMERALAAVGDKALAELLNEDGGAELHCNFCDRRYWFDETALKGLMDAARDADGRDAARTGGE